MEQLDPQWSGWTRSGEVVPVVEELDLQWSIWTCSGGVGPIVEQSVSYTRDNIIP